MISYFKGAHMNFSFEQKMLKKYSELVVMKYQLYNGLFLNLPFESISEWGVNIPIFSKYAKEGLAKKMSPLKIVESYFSNVAKVKDKNEQVKILFRFLQFIERQVVLVDALEESAFEEVEDITGPGSIAHLQSLSKEYGKEENLQKILKDYKVRIVLTAHPTQFYPGTVLSIITDLTRAIKNNDVSEINRLLLQMGKTPFKYHKKPTPRDEARSLIWYLENVFYHVLPRITQSMSSAFSSDGEKCGKPIVDLGFWPGGDRDGNPYVTSSITRKVAMDLKKAVLRSYFKDIDNFRRRLTFDGVYEMIGDIKNKIKLTLEAQSYEADKTKKDNDIYLFVDELLRDLIKVRLTLLEKHQGLFLDDVDSFIYKINNFGFYFASLDLRQDSRIHSQVISEVFKHSKCRPAIDKDLSGVKDGAKKIRQFGELKEIDRLAIIEKLLTSSHLPKRIVEELGEGIAKETILSFKIANEIQRESGEKGLHRYIISNTKSAADIMVVMLLARLAGWKLNQLTLDIVPLFETIDDLENALRSMQVLYDNAIYQNHLKTRELEQTVMLGFSDGTKDGGCVTANWSIYRAKERLTQLSRERSIIVKFFDGRGGPPARGGGNTHKFYRAQGTSIEQKELQLTIQGQTISSRFGSKAKAQFNVENFVTAGLENKLFPEWKNDLNEKQTRLIEAISKHSLNAYSRFKNHPLFLPYLEKRTPLSYFSKLNIASRPAKRKNSDKFKFEDLRAIPFVGAWSQMKQNIPGYYGLGTGLKKVVKQGNMDAVKDLYKNSMFFRTLVENSMQSLKKSFMPLTQYLEKDKEFKSFWLLIKKEMETTVTLLKEITEQKDLMDTAPIIRESIKLREQAVFPLLVIQQFAFIKVQKLESRREDSNVYQKMVIKSLAANINASRNSA